MIADIKANFPVFKLCQELNCLGEDKKVKKVSPNNAFKDNFI